MTLATLSPAACGLDAARLTRIDDWMRRYVDGGRFPFAATLIARKGAIAWASHYGQDDVEAQIAALEEQAAQLQREAAVLKNQQAGRGRGARGRGRGRGFWGRRGRRGRRGRGSGIQFNFF